MPTPRTAAFAVAFAAGVIAGCTCEPTHYEDLRYRCAASEDCVQGYSCVAGVCQPSANGGGAGGGAGGGSTGGGAGGGTGGGAEADAGCSALPEVCGDQVDDNCNGILDDGCPCTGMGRPCYPDGLDSPTLRYPFDGGAGCAAGLQACVSGLLAAACENARVPQLEFCDGQDTDCDGLADPPTCPCQSGRACYQGSPFTPGVGVCRPGVWNCAMPLGQQCVGQVLPAARELCNGLDDDCNGEVDELAETAPCGPGVCASANRICADGGEVVCNYAASPPPGYSMTEVCGDGLDNECDGLVEDGCFCTVGNGIPCWTGSSSACPPDGGACLGVCRRGTQTCAAQPDGGTAYGTCSGQTPASTESCTDSLDNDCDGQRDCADSDCNNRSCGANGRTCSGGSCVCAVTDGGTVQAAETICNDGRDNDCDGLVDCAESACAGMSCGNFGRTCVGTSCSCVVDGGTAQTAELICNDNRDNDCDGLVDCAESACAGMSCGVNGRACSGGACACSGNGGVAQATEATCNDTFDNDCDGLADCSDPNCTGTAACPAMPEVCNDSIDNDGDMLVDCADPQCFHKVCGASSASVCCGTTCTALTTAANCGQCGLTCASGTCSAVGTGSHMSGQCTCPTGASSQCPQPAGFARQSCGTGNLCTCAGNDDQCGNASSGQGSRCISASPLSYCHYQ